MPSPRLLRLSIGLFLCSLLLPGVRVGSASGPSAEVIKHVKRAVVLLTTYDARGQPLLQGSAFYVTANRIVTTRHLLQGASSANIQTIDGQVYPVKGIVAVHETSDLTVLETIAPASPIAPLAIAEALPAEGAQVIAIGNPTGAHWKATRGINLAAWDFQDAGQLLRITARLEPGSSGGPVVNEQGHVVGIATMHTSSGEELNFAVPALNLNTLRAVRLQPLSGSSP